MDPQRGEIYWLPFGTGKKRPVIVISRDTLNSGHFVVVVPCTRVKVEERKHREDYVFVPARTGGLREDSVVAANEITRISKTEINWQDDKIGRLPAPNLQEVVRAIRFVIRDNDLE